jgi:chromosome segregation ATPase
LEESYKERDRLDEEISQLSKQLDAEKAAKIQALSKAEGTINLLSQDNVKLTAENLKLRADLVARTNAFEVAQKNLSTTTDENKKLRDEIVAAHNDTDAQIKKATELTDKLVVAEGQLSLLGERNQQLTTDVSKARAMLKSVGRTLEEPLDANTIRVAGRITDVRRDRVELSIGMDDGVRVGQNLDIYRGDKYVGRLRVVESRPDSAVAAIEPEYQQFPIQRGDNVASRL